MAVRRFVLDARVDTDSPSAVGRALKELLGDAAVGQGTRPGEFIVKRAMEGESAKDLNRNLLSALRRVEKKTRLRASWRSDDGTVFRFFDYVLKAETRPSGL